MGVLRKYEEATQSQLRREKKLLGFWDFDISTGYAR